MPVILLFVPAGALVDRSDRRDAAPRSPRPAPARVGLGLALASYLDAPVAVYLALLVVQGCITVVHAPASVVADPARDPARRARPREPDQLDRSRRPRRSAAPRSPGSALMFFQYWVGLRVRRVHRHRRGHRSIARCRRRARSPRPRDDRERAQGLARRPALHLPLAAAAAGAHARHVRGAVRRRDPLLPVVANDILFVGPFGFGMLRAAQSVGAVAMAYSAAGCRRGSGPAACC